MATKTYFIDSSEATYNDNEFAWFQSLMLTEGVIGEDDEGTLGLGVIQNTPIQDMSVLVGTGKALIEITKSGRTFKVVMENDAEAQLVITGNTTGVNRVDAVIVRLDKDATPNELKTNIATLEVVTGTGATALTDGAIDTAVGGDGWLRLANVTVADDDTDILTADIEDTRTIVYFGNGMGFSPIFIQSSDGATDENKVPALNEHGKINPSMTYEGTFGDGSDGDFDLDGVNEYSGIFTRSGNEYTLLRDLYAENIEIPTGCTLITDGWMIFVNDTLSGAGTLKFPDANAGANGTNSDGDSSSGSPGNGGASSGNGHFPNRAGTNGASTPTADVGGLGNPGGHAAQAGSVTEAASPTNAPRIPFSAAFNWGFKAVWGLDLDENGTPVHYLAPAGGQGGQMGRYQSQGGGGTAGGVGGAGGGGASGGVIWLVVRNWTGTFTIMAIGGDGGDCGTGHNGYYHIGQSTGGAGGAGGVVVIFFRNKTWTGSYNLAGGTAGANAGGSYDYAAAGTSEDGDDGVSYEIQI